MNGKEVIGFSDKGPYFLPFDRKQPCKACGHTYDEHKYMYTMQNHDRMRCCAETTKKTGGKAQCECGKQYEILAVQLPDAIDPTDEKQMQTIIEKVSRYHDLETKATLRRLNGLD